MDATNGAYGAGMSGIDDPIALVDGILSLTQVRSNASTVVDARGSINRTFEQKVSKIEKQKGAASL